MCDPPRHFLFSQKVDRAGRFYSRCTFRENDRSRSVILRIRPAHLQQLLCRPDSDYAHQWKFREAQPSETAPWWRRSMRLSP